MSELRPEFLIHEELSVIEIAETVLDPLLDMVVFEFVVNLVVNYLFVFDEILDPQFLKLFVDHEFRMLYQFVVQLGLLVNALLVLMELAGTIWIFNLVFGI